MSAAQLNMFGAAPVDETTLVGLAITLPEQCPRCNGHDAVIGTGRGPHKASIMCVCGRHLGWMSIATFNFINATVQQFGRPTEPICVNRQRTPAEEKSSTTTTALQEPLPWLTISTTSFRPTTFVPPTSAVKRWT